MNRDKERALIVEDSRTIVSVLKHFLQLEGFDVLVASDGITGLETAQREQPALIVTDVNMPGMGGLDMVRALRADARTQGTIIFMLTSDESAEAKRQALAVGVDDYVLKPVEPRRFAAHLRAVLGRASDAPHE